MSLTWETFPCNNLLSKAMVIHVGLVIIISPWKKTFEKTCLIYTKEALFHVLLNLTQWFCRKKDFQISQILLIHVSPLRKRYTPSFEQTWIPFTKGYFELKLVVICPLFLEKKMFLNVVNVCFFLVGKGLVSSFDVELTLVQIGPVDLRKTF